MIFNFKYDVFRFQKDFTYCDTSDWRSVLYCHWWRIHRYKLWFMFLCKMQLCFPTFGLTIVGLTGSASRSNPLDLPDEYYTKLRRVKYCNNLCCLYSSFTFKILLQSVSELLLVQYGLCAFCWNAESKKWSNQNSIDLLEKFHQFKSSL